MSTVPIPTLTTRLHEWTGVYQGVASVLRDGALSPCGLALLLPAKVTYTVLVSKQ